MNKECGSHLSSRSVHDLARRWLPNGWGQWFVAVTSIVILAAAGVGAAAATGALTGPLQSSPLQESDGMVNVPVISSVAAAKYTKLQWWDPPSSTSPQGDLVRAVVFPFCSQVVGATVTTTGHDVTVAFYGTYVASCNGSLQELDKTYVVQLPETLSGQTLAGMTTPNQSS